MVTRNASTLRSARIRAQAARAYRELMEAEAQLLDVLEPGRSGLPRADARRGR